VARNRTRYGPTEKAYEFLAKRVDDQNAFSIQDLADYCGWKPSTPRTYVVKKWKDFLEPAAPGKFRVKPEFKRISRSQFLGQASQKAPVYTECERAKHDHVVIYEFLLPLTREDKLRGALDDLFFSDCLKQRVREVGLSKLEEVVPRPTGMDDEAYWDHVVEAASIFGGYSVLHVSGRFRRHGLMSRQDAGDLLANGDRYLMDETTAVVRFIIPCQTGRSSFEDDYGASGEIHAAAECPQDQLEAEVRRIRGLFFLLFAEAVVRTVKGEDEIWLVESGVKSRVYRWSVRRGGTTI
jgi:hypothetical protein